MHWYKLGNVVTLAQHMHNCASVFGCYDSNRGKKYQFFFQYKPIIQGYTKASYILTSSDRDYILDKIGCRHTIEYVEKWVLMIVMNHLN